MSVMSISFCECGFCSKCADENESAIAASRTGWGTGSDAAAVCVPVLPGQVTLAVQTHAPWRRGGWDSSDDDWSHASKSGAEESPQIQN